MPESKSLVDSCATLVPMGRADDIVRLVVEAIMTGGLSFISVTSMVKVDAFVGKLGLVGSLTLMENTYCVVFS